MIYCDFIACYGKNYEYSSEIHCISYVQKEVGGKGDVASGKLHVQTYISNFL
jgi:hypothetical protein